MSSTVYVFGNLAEGYTQYPTDSTQDIFKFEYTRALAPAQLVIHRDGNMMYYSYILSFGKYHIGFCTLNNGVAMFDFVKIFEIYKNLVERLVERGYIIGLDENGELRPLTSRLYLNLDELGYITDTLIEAFDQLKYTKLPPVDYSKSCDSIAELALSDGNALISQTAAKNGYTYVYQHDNWASARLNGFISTLKKSKEENYRLKTENDNLKAKIAKVNRQKKQFKLVVFLAIAIIACGVFLFTLNSDLDRARKTIYNQKNIITEQQCNINNLLADIETKDGEIESKNSEINTLKSDKEELEEKLSEFSNAYPIKITNMEFANIRKDNSVINSAGSTLYSNAKYISPVIAYTGLRSGESITLYVRYYRSGQSYVHSASSPSGYTNSASIYVYSGSDNTTSVGGWGNDSGNFWKKGNYRCEIWYNNRCLYSKNFTVY
jgi:hypothetical protein